jgi:hypothetical protein
MAKIRASIKKPRASLMVVLKIKGIKFSPVWVVLDRQTRAGAAKAPTPYSFKLLFTLYGGVPLFNPIRQTFSVPVQILVAGILEKDNCAGRPPAFDAVSVENDGISFFNAHRFCRL